MLAERHSQCPKTSENHHTVASMHVFILVHGMHPTGVSRPNHRHVNKKAASIVTAGIPKSVASGGEVCHLESRMRMLRPSFLGLSHSLTGYAREQRLKFLNVLPAARRALRGLRGFSSKEP